MYFNINQGEGTPDQIPVNETIKATLHVLVMYLALS